MPNKLKSCSHWWQGRLKDCGYKLTVPREAILNVLSKTNKHLSAEDIYLEVHKTHPAIGFTTIYRTLDLLVQMNLISQFDFGDKRARYELKEEIQGKQHHHHLVCIDCGKIVEYSDFLNEETRLIDQAAKELSKKFDFKITNHIIQFYGLCEKCQKK